MRLSDLQTGQNAIITKVLGRGAFRKRIIEMGFIKGKEVSVILSAPLKDPIVYKVMDYEVSLRRSEAELVEVITQTEARKIQDENDLDDLTFINNDWVDVAIEHSKTIHVALVGNPNAGKTSLFNVASGARERVGNYSGVTIDAKEGTFKYAGYTFKLTDLPGTYSLTTYTPEELYVRKQISQGNPDVIVNVVAASNLERNLYLTTQLIDMDAPLVVALNMYDELEQSGAKLDYNTFGKLIGCPMVPTVSKTGKGIEALFDQIISVYEGNSPTARHIHINYGKVLENGILSVSKVLKKNELKEDVPARYLSIKLLENDREVEDFIARLPNAKEIIDTRNAAQQEIQSLWQDDCETLLTDARYGFIDGALKETYTEGKTDTQKTTRMIDSLVTHRFWGYPIFFFFMFLMFECTFLLGEYPMMWLESLVGFIAAGVDHSMSEGPLKDLLLNGIVGGVGNVLVFLPNIIILYLFISFMEDSGYMARAAFIMDKFMHKMGLHGKSFIPLVMGFGCNVPAIMATRTIESRNARLLTMLINPFMSCAARLPVYVLFIRAFFAEHQGVMLFSLYAVGILLAVLVARLFKRFLIKKEDVPFVMELPPYRLPTAKAILRHGWDKASQYMRKMGGIILLASIIIWFLGYFPRNHHISERYEQQAAQIESQYESQPELAAMRDSLIAGINHTQRQELQKHSYIGQLGLLIEPALRPLGFDWKISVSLLSGMAAKEIVVSTLGVLYTGEEDDEISLKKQLVTATGEDGSPAFTPLIVISLLLFVLIYFPCIATIAAIKNESGSWKWAMFTVLYTTALAWVICFCVYQIGGLLCGNI